LYKPAHWVRTSQAGLIGNVEASLLSPDSDPVSLSVKLGIAIETSSVQGFVVFLGEKGYIRLKR